MMFCNALFFVWEYSFRFIKVQLNWLWLDYLSSRSWWLYLIKPLFKCKKCSIQPRLILSSNSYVCISIPILNWRLICAKLQNFMVDKHKDMATYVLRLSIYMGNNNIVIHILTCLQVICHAHNILILYEMRFYDWIQDKWLQHSCNYKATCFIRNIHPWAFKLTR